MMLGGRNKRERKREKKQREREGGMRNTDMEKRVLIIDICVCVGV